MHSRSGSSRPRARSSTTISMAWAAKRISGPSSTSEDPASVKDRSPSLGRGSDRRNFVAAGGSTTYPGAVHNERSSQVLEKAAEPTGVGLESSSSSGQAIGIPPASGSWSVSCTSSPSRSAAAIPAMSETARRKPSGSRAKGWGGIRRAARRREPGVDRRFPPSAQRARRPDPVSQAAWRTIIRPYWRGAATAPALNAKTWCRAWWRGRPCEERRGRATPPASL